MTHGFQSEVGCRAAPNIPIVKIGFADSSPFCEDGSSETVSKL